MKKYPLTIVSVILIVILATATFSFMPASHKNIGDQALKSNPHAPISQTIKANYDDWLACNILTDFTLFYYFNEGFASIGKEYRFTHSQSLCPAMVSLATNQAELACAYGVCSHAVMDSYAHNDLVPASIAASGMPNGIIHIFAEEKVDDNIYVSQDKEKVSTALLNAGPNHKEFFRKATVAKDGLATASFDSAYDGFIDQVVGSTKFTPGFAGFISVPMTFHIFLLGIALLGFAGSLYFIKQRNKGLFQNLAMGISMFFSVFIGIVYIFFFFGKLWWLIQFISTPISAITPTPNADVVIQNSVAATSAFFNAGPAYMSSIRDPSGRDALQAASAQVMWKLHLILFVIGALIIYIVWRGIRRI